MKIIEGVCPVQACTVLGHEDLVSAILSAESMEGCIKYKSINRISYTRPSMGQEMKILDIIWRELPDGTRRATAEWCK